MRRLAPKREQQAFVARAVQLLLALGATKEKEDDDCFYLQTKAGRLMLHPTENAGIGLGTVFTRFDDPQAARQFVDCNPHSGKWNHHYFDGWTAEAALADLTCKLHRVLDNAGSEASTPH